MNNAPTCAAIRDTGTGWEMPGFATAAAREAATAEAAGRTAPAAVTVRAPASVRAARFGVGEALPVGCGRGAPPAEVEAPTAGSAVGRLAVAMPPPVTKTQAMSTVTAQDQGRTPPARP
ncbi:hypothetical protein GCM10009753_47880 [Streptantibioticus ferralitis]